jgi:hypothetical protein
LITKIMIFTRWRNVRECAYLYCRQLIFQYKRTYIHWIAPKQMLQNRTFFMNVQYTCMHNICIKFCYPVKTWFNLLAHLPKKIYKHLLMLIIYLIVKIFVMFWYFFSLPCYIYPWHHESESVYVRHGLQVL